MSLRDTIEGARKEALENVAPPKGESTREEPGEDKGGFSRKSAAKAKPVREAGASVRVSGKPKSSGIFGGSETKEQKKERRRLEREEEDLRNRAYDLIMRSLPGYKQTERVFWVFLVVGFLLAVVSVVLSYMLGGQSDFTTPEGVASAVTLVLAYVFIIGGFIYNLIKRRPFRQEAENRIRSMSSKKMLELLENDRRERYERKAKKSGKN